MSPGPPLPSPVNEAPVTHPHSSVECLYTTLFTHKQIQSLFTNCLPTIHSPYLSQVTLTVKERESWNRLNSAITPLSFVTSAARLLNYYWSALTSLLLDLLMRIRQDWAILGCVAVSLMVDREPVCTVCGLLLSTCFRQT